MKQAHGHCIRVWYRGVNGVSRAAMLSPDGQSVLLGDPVLSKKRNHADAWPEKITDRHVKRVPGQTPVDRSSPAPRQTPVVSASFDMLAPVTPVATPASVTQMSSSKDVVKKPHRTPKRRAQVVVARMKAAAAAERSAQVRALQPRTGGRGGGWEEGSFPFFLEHMDSMRECVAAFRGLEDRLQELARTCSGLESRIADAQGWVDAHVSEPWHRMRVCAMRRHISSWRAQLAQLRESHWEWRSRSLEKATSLVAGHLRDMVAGGGSRLPEPRVHMAISFGVQRNRRNAMFPWDIAADLLCRFAGLEKQGVVSKAMSTCDTCGSMLAAMSLKGTLMCVSCRTTVVDVVADDTGTVSMASASSGGGKARKSNNSSSLGMKLNEMEARLMGKSLTREVMLSIMDKAYTHMRVREPRQQWVLRLFDVVNFLLSEIKLKNHYTLIGRIKMGLTNVAPPQLTPRLRKIMMTMEPMIQRLYSRMKASSGNSLSQYFTTFHVLRYVGHPEFQSELKLLSFKNCIKKNTEFVEPIFKELQWGDLEEMTDSMTIWDQAEDGSFTDLLRIPDYSKWLRSLQAWTKAWSSPKGPAPGQEEASVLDLHSVAENDWSCAEGSRPGGGGGNGSVGAGIGIGMVPLNAL